MLEFLRGKGSNRKLRLFACACCRSLFPLIADKYSRQAIKTAERYADGKVSSEKFRFARGSARRSAQAQQRLRRHGSLTAEDHALWAVALAVEENVGQIVSLPATINLVTVMAKRSGMIPNTVDEVGFLRHIIGNPFRPCPAPPSWPSTVVQLAESLYAGQDCAFALHDALLEAGHAELAEHFREEKSHPKGCWVVDLILGKK
jgi:hypothetical protein